MLAIGNDFGEVKLFNYPCIDPKANCSAYYGHSAHVTKVVFSALDDYLVSTGGGDMTVLIYDTDVKVDRAKPQYEPNQDDIAHDVRHDKARENKRRLKQEQEDQA